MKTTHYLITMNPNAVLLSKDINTFVDTFEFTYLSKKIGHDSKTVLVKWLSDETIFGGWEESVRFRTRTSKNTITTTRAKITRYAISETSYFEEPSRIHALIGNATYYYVTQHCRSLSILKTFPVKTLSVKIYVDLYRKFIQALHEAYLERQFET